jgi:uncharacterized membrane protein YdjX (TVP38/TMEM64 family)
MRLKLISLIVIFLGCLYGAEWLGLLSLAEFKAHFDILAEQYRTNPVISTLVYLFLFTLINTIGIPGNTIFILYAGAVYSLQTATMLIVFCRTIGGGNAFLLARYLFYEQFCRRYPKFSRKVQEGIEKDGAFYLAILRLVPVLPANVVNFAMGITGIRFTTFIWVTAIGIIPWTVIFAKAGQELSEIETARDLVQLDLLIIFSVIALGSFGAKKWKDSWEARRLREQEQ